MNWPREKLYTRRAFHGSFVSGRPRQGAASLFYYLIERATTDSCRFHSRGEFTVRSSYARIIRARSDCVRAHPECVGFANDDLERLELAVDFSTRIPIQRALRSTRGRGSVEDRRTARLSRAIVARRAVNQHDPIVRLYRGLDST